MGQNVIVSQMGMYKKMERVIRYVTYDKEEHKTIVDAQKHLDVLYGNILCPLAAKMAQICKYVAMGDYIDENLDLFLELDKIKKDSEVFCDFDD